MSSSALIAFLAGIVMAAAVSGMSTRVYNSTMIYDVLLVVVLGGISLSGGRGGVRNVLVGTLLVGVLLNGMTILDIAYTTQNLIKSLILLLRDHRRQFHQSHATNRLLNRSRETSEFTATWIQKGGTNEDENYTGCRPYDARPVRSALAQADDGLDNPSRNPFYDGMKGKRVVFVPLAMGFDLTEGWAAIMRKQADDSRLHARNSRPELEHRCRYARARPRSSPRSRTSIIAHNPDVQSYARLLKRAMDAGIKVIQLNLESVVPTDAYIGADWSRVGYIQADDAGEAVRHRLRQVGQDRDHAWPADRRFGPL